MITVSISCDGCGTRLDRKLAEGEQVGFKHEQDVRGLARTSGWHLLWWPGKSTHLCPDCKTHGVHGSDHNPHPCAEGCSACPPESKVTEGYARSQGFTSQAEMRGEDWS